MQQRSTMILRNVTCVDHAYIGRDGKIHGGSYHPSFEVSGLVDRNEQVVIDFSKVKKLIKATIDDKDDGFDHKLWMILGYSGGEVISSAFNEIMFFESDSTYAEIPVNAVKWIEVKKGQYDISKIAEEAMAEQVESVLRAEYPASDIRVKCINSIDAFSDQPTYFQYWHGLKESSSYGCKSLFHGHLSFIEVYDVENKRNKEVEKIIADYLKDCVFVFSENIRLLNPTSMMFGYNVERGAFRATLKNNEYNIVMMDKETTIENIVEHVADRIRFLKKHYRLSRLVVSEGLAKGAVVDL